MTSELLWADDEWLSFQLHELLWSMQDGYYVSRNRRQSGFTFKNTRFFVATFFFFSFSLADKSSTQICVPYLNLNK
jgi:hypothetical protein